MNLLSHCISFSEKSSFARFLRLVYVNVKIVSVVLVPAKKAIILIKLFSVYLKLILVIFSMLLIREIMKFTVSATIVAIFLMECSFSLAEEFPESFPRVVTPLGTIEGYYKTSSSGRRYEAYEGIRYAHPPTENLRFGVAETISPWIGVFMAKQFGPGCMQLVNFLSSDVANEVVGSEDCLYMNIYTPIPDDHHLTMNREENNLFPVIFYIHGGAFQFGNSKSFKSEQLLNRNVTLVIINYRVGPFGFLSTEDEVVPGNMGLKDQVIALRWVKDNIQSFGGDPSRITIFGQSAGGASVHYHYLTNLTAGLFQRGMSLSGTALNPWAQTENSLENAKKLATIVGCPTKNTRRMVSCLKSRPAHQIVKAVVNSTSLTGSVVSFGPVIEKGGGNFTFIDRSPIEIINSGRAHDVPWITGIVSEEGLVVVGTFATNKDILERINDNWETVAPGILDFSHTVPKIDHPKIARLIKEHYLGTSPTSTITFNQTRKMSSDRMFGYSAEEAATLQAKANRSPVRFYYFSYRGAHSFSEILTGSSENFGVSHSDDETYVLEALFDPTTTPEDRAMQKTLVDIWVSFASDGSPIRNASVEWPAVNGSMGELTYLHIAGPDQFSVKTSLNFGEKNFWHSLGIHENQNITLA